MKSRIQSLLIPFYFYGKVGKHFLTQKYLLIIVTLVLIYPTKSYSTHIGGADLSYKWISGNTFELRLTLFRDCSGIAAPNSVSINYKSASCGYNLNVILSKIAGTGNEITKPCDSTITNCNGGSSPGIQKYEYSANVTLPSKCSDWVFGYSICCRNCAITTLYYTPNNCSGVPATYIEATLNNLVTPDNSSPVFTNVPVSFFCIGQEFHYNHGAYDPDGDSLVYSFIDPRSAASTPVVFTTGYSATNPISSSPPISIAANGDIVMTPTAQEVGVMTILVQEYRNGVLIGSVVRDMEVWTSPCSNILPTASGINGTNNFNIVACPGKPISFNINCADPDVSQNVLMDWNHAIPGGVFTSTSNSRPVGTFSWTPSISDARKQPYTFTVTVQDNNCPFNGFQTYSYNITVHDLSVAVNSTNSNCSNPGTGTTLAIPTGDAPFQYSWAPGGATSASVNGLSAGNYTVTITDKNGCTSTAATIISASSTLSAVINSYSDPVCNGANNGVITVNGVNGLSPYTYSWSPSGGTGASATGLSAGTYTVTITDAGNCTFSISQTLTQPPALNIVVTGSALLCNGDASGFASVTTSGGTGGYNYLWSNGATTASINNLIAGSYSVKVTDAFGCTKSANINLTQPSALTGSVIASSPVKCFGGNDGAGEISANGGTAPYTYSWFPSGNPLASASGLSAGNYVVTVKDAHNCIATVPMVINQPAILTSSINNYGNVLCFGDSSGYANVFETGGTPPYNYLWSSGENTSFLTGLIPGNYSVKITDMNGCSSTSSITISQPAPLTINSLSITDVSCFGGSDGSASVSPSGGTSPFTYQWSPSGGTGSIAGNLSKGNYTVTITDTNGCSATLPLTINEPTAVVATVNTKNTTCFNGTDGSATVTASGGMGPYTYLWNPGNYTSSTVNGLNSGNYNLIVNDSRGCSDTATFTINQPLELVISLSSNTATCGNSNGSASVSVAGGTPGYYYFWSPLNSNSDSIYNLPAGSYTITVEDSNGCTVSEVATVSNAGAATITLASVTPVSCNGNNDGSASVTLSGGAGPFKYLWLPSGGTGPSASGLSAGTYTVQVSGKHKCVSVLSIDIPEPLPIQVIATITQVSCFGLNDGKVSLNVSGGNGIYNYTWSSLIGNSPSANNLPSGNYSVDVTDQKGCTGSSVVNVTEPALLSAVVINPTHVTCFGGKNGSATVNVSGGTPPYSYYWSVPGNTSASITNLPAGNFSVTVTDAAGCKTLTGVIINQPSLLIAQTSSNPGTCNLPNGTAAVNISGGNTPYTYLWNQTGDTTASVTGLPSGNFIVTVTDSSGCQLASFVDVTNTGMFNATLGAVINVSCNGGKDASAVLNIIKGTSPYSYDWQPLGGTSSVATGLVAGNYNVLITDASNCKMNVPVTINEPPPLSAIVTTTHIKCSGAGNGAASILASGGTGAYTYQWLPGGMNTSFIGSLNGGNYIAKVTDANSCNVSKQFVINEPSPLILTTTSTKAGCSLSNGSTTINVTGGAPPYQYLWSPGGMQTKTILGIAAGSYAVSVTDSNNCISNATASVSNTTGPSASLLNILPVNCYGGKDGAAEVKINGGVSPYTIKWNPYGGTSLFADSLSAGSYSVNIRDANNCFTVIPVTISQPPKLHSSITPTMPLCNNGNDGSAIATINGGIPPYTFSWTSGDTTSLATGLNVGTYSLSVTDAKGCITTFNTTIQQPTPVNLNTFSSPVNCFGRNDGFAAVIAFGGTPGYTYLWSNGYTYNSGSNFFAGNYSINVTDAHGCKRDSSVTITEPTQIILAATSVSESCRGLGDGRASVNVTGGTPPYTYSWWPVGGNGPTATNLPMGGYDIVVDDLNGCRHKINVNIGSPTPIHCLTNFTNAKCNGGNDGTATVTASGGTPPYTYFWSNGSSGNIAANLQAGIYSVVVTDNNSCTTEVSITVNQPPPMEPLIILPSSICIGQSATISVQCTGGTPGYTFTWNNGSHNIQQTVSPSSTSNYSVVVTDSRGCKSNPAIGIVKVNAGLIALASGPDTVCEGTFATLLAFGSGGDGGPYTYSWDNGASGDVVTIAPSVSGNYTVTVTDGCGSPPAMVSVTVIVRPNPVVNFISDPAIGCQPLEVHFKDATDLDGTEYYWNFGDGTSDTIRDPSHIYTLPGNYTVNHLVKTVHGCIGKSMVPAGVKVYPLPVAKFSNVPDSASIRIPIISFIDGSTNTEKWEWDFGDNSGIVFSMNIEHTYKDTGTYLVKLITTSDQGCIDTAYGYVTIKEDFAVYIPNAFTPNNDGINDTFISLGMGIKDFEMFVYDRWGIKIFYSSDMKKGWDGKEQGKDTPCQSDVYLYKINIIDVDGVNHNYLGRVSLVR